MKIKALKSFSGSLSMSKGEVVNCNRMDVVNDLLKAGYVEEVEETKVIPAQSEQNVKQPLENNKKTGRRKKDEN